MYIFKIVVLFHEQSLFISEPSSGLYLPHQEGEVDFLVLVGFVYVSL